MLQVRFSFDANNLFKKIKTVCSIPLLLVFIIITVQSRVDTVGGEPGGVVEGDVVLPPDAVLLRAFPAGDGLDVQTGLLNVNKGQVEDLEQ